MFTAHRSMSVVRDTCMFSTSAPNTTDLYSSRFVTSKPAMNTAPMNIRVFLQLVHSSLSPGFSKAPDFLRNCSKHAMMKYIIPRAGCFQSSTQIVQRRKRTVGLNNTQGYSLSMHKKPVWSACFVATTCRTSGFAELAFTSGKKTVVPAGLPLGCLLSYMIRTITHG